MSTPVSTERIIECLRETNGLVSLAAKRVPCSITTINVRRKRVQAVEQVIQECRGELVDLGELALRKAVLAGEPWAVSLVLKTLGKERGYVERQETSGPDGGPIGLAFDLDSWKRQREARRQELADVEDPDDVEPAEEDECASTDAQG